MKKLKKKSILLLAVLLSASMSYGEFQVEDSLYSRTCEGYVTVNGDSTKEAKLYFNGPYLAYYTGPHASLSLPYENLELEFTIGGSSWLRANLSSGSGHGGEVNIFSYQNVNDGSINFLYRGSLGYQVEGNLECKDVTVGVPN